VQRYVPDFEKRWSRMGWTQFHVAVRLTTMARMAKSVRADNPLEL
jgi:hypothetical protein